MADRVVVKLLGAALVLAIGLGSLAGPAAAQAPDKVSLRLKWLHQSQFAGYYAAQDQGFYADQCLDVTIVEGGVDIVPQQQLADGAVDFALAWVPKALATREAGAHIVDIAQVFQRSGTLQVSFADAGITTPADFAGKTVGNWGFGNEYEIFAALAQANLDPATDVTLVQQDFDMSGLLSGDIDAAEAMIYNEYAQVLETMFHRRMFVKAAINGVPNLSVDAGWWPEGYTGLNGWLIDSGDSGGDQAAAETIYRLLEEQLVPAFYERDERGVPVRWMAIVKEAIRTVAPRFCARRMLKQYIEQMYLPQRQLLEAR